MLRASTQDQRGFKRKARRIGEPVGIVFKAGAFPVARTARPQPPDIMRDACQIDIDEEFAVANG
jgi:hypothetical protein